MSTGNQVIADAFVEIGSYAAGETIAGEHLTLAQTRINQIINSWAARKVYAYNVDFTEYTLTANHQPHLIGPGLASPDFAAARPVTIENAALVLTNVTPNVDLPLNIRDDDWWANKRVKTLATSVPTSLYYSPGHPNGALYLWPVPTVVYGLRLKTWTVLSEITDFAATFSGPYGYELALLLTLAEALCRPMGKQKPPDLIADARAARSTIMKNNDQSPRISLDDRGASRGAGDFNWYTGGVI